MATMALKGEPWMAREMAWRTAQVVKTAVGRPIHVAIVRGLNKNLSNYQDHDSCKQNITHWVESTHAAATTSAEARLARRGEE